MEQEFLLSGSQKDNKQQKTSDQKCNKKNQTIKYGVEMDETKSKLYCYYFISYFPITTRFEQ